MKDLTFNEIIDFYSNEFKNNSLFEKSFVISSFILLYEDTKDENINFYEAILYGDFMKYKDRLSYYLNSIIDKNKIKVNAEKLNGDITKSLDKEIGGVIGKGLSL